MNGVLDILFYGRQVRLFLEWRETIIPVRQPKFITQIILRERVCQYKMVFYSDLKHKN